MPHERLRPDYTFDEERLTALREIAPEAFADGKVNWAALKEALGGELEDDETDEEHFGLFWPGKREARKLASRPSSGTLVPVKGEGINEETTRNIFIEGENLEVLKILRKSYAGRVKMIYIDPPYNTGNDFVYDDDFTEPLQDYLKRTGQADGEGRPMTTNKRADGRFHSRWLSMMYPRLRLARELLRDDGVIFVSIDDNEVHHLRMLMNEVFGEENFVCEFIWEKKKKPSFLHRNVGKLTEYILCFVKNYNMSFPFSIEQTEEGKKTPINNAGNSYSRLTFPAGSVSFNLPDQVVQPQDMSKGNILTKLVMPVKIKSHRNENDLVLEGEWRYSQKTMDEIINLEDQIRISKIPFRPNHIKSGGKIKKMKNMLTPSHYGMATNEDATAMLTEIFGGKDVFDYPKPVELLKTLTKAVTYMDEGALVVDFFAGTGTMAHAVLDLNREDGGYRQFILVQLPELSPTDSPAFKAGYHSIADIGKERIRRSVKKLQKENPDGIENQDFGFKVLKLTHPPLQTPAELSRRERGGAEVTV